MHEAGNICTKVLDGTTFSKHKRRTTPTGRVNVLLELTDSDELIFQLSNWLRRHELASSIYN